MHQTPQRPDIHRVRELLPRTERLRQDPVDLGSDIRGGAAACSERGIGRALRRAEVGDLDPDGVQRGNEDVLRR